MPDQPLTVDEIIAKISEITQRRIMALEKIVEPARSAANAMVDAKMTRSAGPLNEALFAYDAIVDELKTVDLGPQACEVMLRLLENAAGRRRP